MIFARRASNEVVKSQSAVWVSAGSVSPRPAGQGRANNRLLESLEGRQLFAASGIDLAAAQAALAAASSDVAPVVVYPARLSTADADASFRPMAPSDGLDRQVMNRRDDAPPVALRSWMGAVWGRPPEHDADAFGPPAAAPGAAPARRSARMSPPLTQVAAQSVDSALARKDSTSDADRSNDSEALRVAGTGTDSTAEGSIDSVDQANTGSDHSPDASGGLARDFGAAFAGQTQIVSEMSPAQASSPRTAADIAMTGDLTQAALVAAAPVQSSTDSQAVWRGNPSLESVAVTGAQVAVEWAAIGVAGVNALEIGMAGPIVFGPSAGAIGDGVAVDPATQASIDASLVPAAAKPYVAAAIGVVAVAAYRYATSPVSEQKRKAISFQTRSVRAGWELEPAGAE